MADNRPTSPDLASRAIVAALLCLLLTACATDTAPKKPPIPIANTYPVRDGIRATVVGTPPAHQADLPHIDIRVRDLPPLVARSVPAVLDYARPLHYTLATWHDPAPLVFIIAGTGAQADSAKCRQLMRMIHAEGYHTVCLPSPTTVNFMLGAARHPVPGYMPADVAALNRLMHAVAQDLPDDVTVTGHALVGYSLGATQAAFLAYHDHNSRDGFGFDRVLLVNPAVSVWKSVQRMDALIRRNLPGGVDNVPAFLGSLLAELDSPDSRQQPLHIDRATLFRASLARQATHRQLAAVVGLSFRLALANMAFAADLLTHSDVIVPRDARPTISTPLGPYLRRSFDLTFSDYINELLLPYWNHDGRTLSRTQLIKAADLHGIRDWLASRQRITVTTNADDPILGDDDIAFLRRTFGHRAHIHPHGGHMGNLMARNVVHFIQRLFAQ